jgi:hypothetical protein
MFIPRHPVVENQFCSYGSQTGSGAAGIGGVIAYAGSVVYLDPSATNEESVVFKMAIMIHQTPFGFSMQKVKTGYHQVHPAGMVLPGDLGSSDVIAQPLYNASGAITGTKAAPVGVAHLGIWDTVHYTCTSVAGEAGTVSAKMTPGDSLYAAVMTKLKLPIMLLLLQMLLILLLMKIVRSPCCSSRSQGSFLPNVRLMLITPHCILSESNCLCNKK